MDEERGRIIVGLEDAKEIIDAVANDNCMSRDNYRCLCSAESNINDAIVFLKVQEPESTIAETNQQPRLLTPDEIHQLQDRETVCVEQLLSRKEDERGYITGKGWGVACNSTGADHSGLLISLLGTFFPDVIQEIPYRAIQRDENGKIIQTLYRFWTGRPTSEQSEATPWQ